MKPPKVLKLCKIINVRVWSSSSSCALCSIVHLRCWCKLGTSIQVPTRRCANSTTAAAPFFSSQPSPQNKQLLSSVKHVKHLTTLEYCTSTMDNKGTQPPQQQPEAAVPAAKPVEQEAAHLGQPIGAAAGVVAIPLATPILGDDGKAPKDGDGCIGGAKRHPHIIGVVLTLGLVVELCGSLYCLCTCQLGVWCAPSAQPSMTFLPCFALCG